MIAAVSTPIPGQMPNANSVAALSGRLGDEASTLASEWLAFSYEQQSGAAGGGQSSAP
jgi:hypothetical protein